MLLAPAGVFLFTTNVRTKVSRVNVFRLVISKLCPYISVMKPRMGRPPKSGKKPMGERLEIRVDAAEKSAYEKAAQSAGLERAEWVRHTLNSAAKKALRIDT